jgi:hypothetical protein
MRSIVLFTVIIAFLLGGCRTQSGLINIQEASIKDSVVMRELIKLIEERERVDSSFARGYGYFDVEYISLHGGTAYAKYLISPNEREWDEDDEFPPFYTFVNERLVLLHSGDLQTSLKFRYNRTSKKKLSKMINERIDPAQKKASRLARDDFYQAMGHKAPKKFKKSELPGGMYAYGTTTIVYISWDGRKDNYEILYNQNP